MDARILVVMAKYPRPGSVKTRLCPPLNHQSAALLSLAFIRDAIGLAEGVSCDARYLAVHPEYLAASLKEEIGSEMAVIPQEGNDLGERMFSVVRRAFFEGTWKSALRASDRAVDGKHLVIIGSDSPTLPIDFVNLAFVRLQEFDLAIGPSSDGGYYLIGMSKPVREIFEGVEWGSDGALQQTMKKAKMAGLSVCELPEWYDIDTPKDLSRLKAELARRHDVAKNTRAILDRLHS